jgi:hypothetical protein
VVGDQVDDVALALDEAGDIATIAKVAKQTEFVV